eukprot:TRINITY_DN3472_c0_g1_i2.p1 TRINITY_DN3472_c0_g1~~TRINITY_DN3472_c0_g1_i2.p1  ORF type:complete len:184 (-),score=60.32 TRINITY_DN3472_c0_g1_i2:198-668(-)
MNVVTFLVFLFLGFQLSSLSLAEVVTVTDDTFKSVVRNPEHCVLLYSFAQGNPMAKKFDELKVLDKVAEATEQEPKVLIAKMDNTNGATKMGVLRARKLTNYMFQLKLYVYGSGELDYNGKLSSPNSFIHFINKNCILNIPLLDSSESKLKRKDEL